MWCDAEAEGGDGDVDLDDYAVFADCLSGPDQVPVATSPLSTYDCFESDTDADFDVDLADFAGFQEAFGGS